MQHVFDTAHVERLLGDAANAFVFVHNEDGCFCGAASCSSGLWSAKSVWQEEEPTFDSYREAEDWIRQVDKRHLTPATAPGRLPGQLQARSA